jgi:hypothetical protein
MLVEFVKGGSCFFCLSVGIWGFIGMLVWRVWFMYRFTGCKCTHGADQFVDE